MKKVVVVVEGVMVLVDGGTDPVVVLPDTYLVDGDVEIILLMKKMSHT